MIRYYELLVSVSEIVSVGRFLEDKCLVTGKEVSQLLVTEKVVQYHHDVWQYLSRCVTIGDTRDVIRYPHNT